MVINPEERKVLKKKMTRLVIFLLPTFLLDGFFAYLFYVYTNMHPVLCGFLIIVITSILYLLFCFICAKIDKKKQERLAKSGKKDPFKKNQ